MKKSDFKIEKGIPCPKRYQPQLHLPFADMQVGDSFSLETDQYTRVTGGASYYSARHNKKFSIRRDGSKYRCWRVA